VLSFAEETAAEKPKEEVSKMGETAVEKMEKLRAVPGTRVEPVSFMRKSIADHMIKSAITAVHVTNVVEVDMTNVSEFRNKHKDEFKKKEGFSLSYLPIVAKVTVEALKEFPIVNALLTDDSVVYHDYVNLGIAVALEDGLIVPVIKRADEKSVVGLARSINDLAARARGKRLVPDDVREGTFSITNQGVFGSMFSTPIINYPQAAILSLETIIKRATVIDDAIIIKPMVYLPLSWDHRIMDGAIAAKFLSKVKDLLERWDIEQPL
jgi:pyruvate/2-oxoglutarate dehydrogenase complex dihydrolipoamide acyltransferase (E2) component